MGARPRPDEGFAQFASQLSGRSSEWARTWAAEQQAVIQEPVAAAAPGTPATPRAATAATPRAAATRPLPRTPLPLTQPPRAGQRVLVPHELWPTFACQEHGGVGWAAVVLSATKYTALVRFEHATTADGRPYEPIRLCWEVLQQLS